MVATKNLAKALAPSSVWARAAAGTVTVAVPPGEVAVAVLGDVGELEGVWLPLEAALPEGVGSAFAPVQPASTSMPAVTRAAIRAVA